MTISCQQCREELAEYALEQGEAAQFAAIGEHLARCPECRAELAAIEAAWAALPMSLPMRAPSLELFERIASRIDEVATPRAAQRTAVAHGASPLTRRQRLFSYALAASVFIGLSVGYWWLLHPSDDQAAAQRSVEKLAERMGELQQMEQLLKSDTVRLVSLHRPDEPKASQAFVLWDISGGQWHFFAEHLPQPPAGKTYQLWAENRNGGRIAGPTFAVNADGLGSVIADMAELGPSAATKAVVTLEPAGGSKEPTGKAVLEAAL